MGIPLLLGLDAGREVPVAPADLAALLGLGNKLLNGNFGVNQRVVSGTVTLGAGQFGHDRWKAGSNGCTYSFTTSGPDTVLTITAGTLQQKIEPGTVEGGFYSLSWAGTAPGGIGVSGGAVPSYATSPALSASANAGQALVVEFSTGTLGFVTLVAGKTPSAPAAFVRRPNEADLCLRHFFRMRPGSGFGNFGTAVATDASHASMVVRFLREMRANPTLTPFSSQAQGFYLKGDPTVAFAGSAFSLNGVGPQGVEIGIAVSGLTAGRSFPVNAYNDAAAYLDFSADY